MRCSSVRSASQVCAFHLWDSVATTLAAGSITRHRALVVHKALDLGITFFDTADVYRSNIGGSEEFLGQALGPRRKDIVLATKVGMPMEHGRRGASRQTIMAGVEASLRRLNTDWIDLYQHAPTGSTDANRGNAAGVRRHRAPGEGSLHRLLQSEGVASGGRAMDGAHEWPDTVCIMSERIQPADA